MANVINQFFHATMGLAYAFTLYKGCHLNIPFLAETYKKYDPGQLKFLTIWNVILQTVFFFICLVNDWFGSNAVNPKKPPLIRKVKDYVHASIGFPISMMVGITFWGLMAIDRELVFPKAIDPYFPWWLNHLMHTMIMVTTVIEMVLAPRKYPSRFKGLAGLWFFEATYIIWLHIVYYKSGVWVYPVLEVMTLPVRVVFLGSLLISSAVVYIVGEALDNFVWGKKYVAENDEPDLKA